MKIHNKSSFIYGLALLSISLLNIFLDKSPSRTDMFDFFCSLIFSALFFYDAFRKQSDKTALVTEQAPKSELKRLRLTSILSICIPILIGFALSRGAATDTVKATVNGLVLCIEIQLIVSWVTALFWHITVSDKRN